MKRILYTIIFVLCFAVSAFGADHYVDCTDEGTDVGTFANPFQSIEKVNDHAMVEGDDVYFAVNTTCTLTAGDPSLTIDWDGVDGNNYAVIGAYYGNGQFGLNGNARPIIDGDSWTYPAPDSGAIQYRNRPLLGGEGYVHIKDLMVQYLGGTGIIVSYEYTPEKYHTDYNKIENCYIKKPLHGGILVARGSNNTVINNVIDRAQYEKASGPYGSGLEISGMSVGGETVTQNNLVTGNRVFNCYEGIGIYKGARYTTVEYNVVYDNRSFHLYIANARDAIVRYNLVYETPAQLWNDSGNGKDYLIGTDCEGHEEVIKTTGSVEIYGNLIAGGLYGIFMINNCITLDEPVYQTNNLIYNNTMVDNEVNIHIDQAHASSSGNVIKNNISWIKDAIGGVHTDDCNALGVTWENNLWSSDPGTGTTGCDNDATDPPNLAPELVKTGAWLYLVANAVTGTEFSLLPASPAIDEGEDLLTYDNMINPNTVDFVVTPINVDLLDGSLFGAAHDIGAMVYALYMTDFTPSSGATGQNITVDGNWTNPTGTNSNTIYLDVKATHDPPTTDIHPAGGAASAVETHDFGTLAYDTEYAWRNDIVHAGGTQEGVVYYFTTTSPVATGSQYPSAATIE